MDKDWRVVRFEDVGKDDIPIVGGKGANLGEMTKAGVPVPPGFIVTAQSYFYFLEPDFWKLMVQVEQLRSRGLPVAGRQISAIGAVEVESRPALLAD